MSRIRTVKPELFKHEELFEAEQKEQLPLRLAFIGLLTCCDREGRFRWQPRRLALDMLPYDEINLSCVLDALAYHGFIKKYEHEGKYYGCIPSWKAHQQINNKETASTLPSLQRSTVIEVQTKSSILMESQPVIHISEAESEVPDLVNAPDAVELVSTAQQPVVIESELVNSAATLSAIVSKFVDKPKKADVLPAVATSFLVEEQITTHTTMPLAEESPVAQEQEVVNLVCSPEASESAAIQNESALSLPLVSIDSPLHLNKTLDTCESRVNHASLTREPRVNHALNTEELRINHACSEDLSGKEGEGKGKGKEEERNGRMIASRTRPSSLIKPIMQVFEHWKTVMNYPSSRLDDARTGIIKRALSSGYSIEQLCYAITGCSLTPHNMGDNERGQRFDGLHVILRDADQIDRFIRNFQKPPKSKTLAEKHTESNIHTLQNWINAKMQEKTVYGRA